MADTKISELPNITAVLATDSIPIVQDGLNKKATAGQFRAFVSTELPVAESVLEADTVAIVQDGLNKKATAGQFRTYVLLPIVNTVTAAAIPLTSTVAIISGACTLGAGTYVGQEIKIVSSDVGVLSAVGLLPSDGFTFTADNTLVVLWANSKWNILSVNGMTTGIL